MTLTARNVSKLAVVAVALAALLAAMLLVAQPMRAYASDNGHPVVVSLGDSYSSGEGVEPFYGQNDVNKNSNEDWLAHRSEKAWAGQLKVDGITLSSLKDDGWYFKAASGAVADNVIDDSDGRQKKEYNNSAGKGEYWLPNQLDVFASENLKDKVDYVTLTLGGNDLGFSDIVVTAAISGWANNPNAVKQAVNSALVKFKNETKVKLAEAYVKIREAAGDQAKIIVVGYPHIAPESQGGIFSKSEAAAINTGVDAFDTEIERLIESSNDENIYFVDVRQEFMGHAAYEHVSYINEVMWKAQPQDLKSRLIASAYSIHPNADGQAAYARAVQAKIDEIEAQQASQVTAAGIVPVTGNVDVAMSLVYDTSGSMDTSSAMSGMTRLESAKKQSSDFVRSVATQVADGSLTAQIGVAQFSTDASTACALTSDTDAVLAGIASLKATDMTNMYAGLAEGIGQLKASSSQKIMVFLSDGLNNEGHSDSEVLDLAREAASEGIKVYTIGFGPSASIDEDLLQEIASITGGKYAHEDSSSLSSATVGLYGTMAEAQYGATEQVLLSQTGTVGQGQTTQVGTFDVNQNGTVDVILYWPGSVLDMQLTDPDGTLVGAGYSGYTIDTSAIPTRIKITNAKQGTWNMSVYGQQTSMAEEPFYALAALDNTQTQPAAAAVATGGGVASAGHAETLLFLLVVVVIACLGGVYALSKRKGSDG